MKRPVLFSVIAGATLFVAAPVAVMAGGADPRVPPAAQDAYGGYDYAACAGGFSDPYAAAERLDDLRSYYTGKIIRFRLAGMLSAQETALGIRPDQMEAWRAYTQAVLALVPDRKSVVSLIGAPEEGEMPRAFARAEALSDMLAGYSGKAEALKQAIEGLRGQLTPEQLEAARMPRLSWIPRD